MTTVKPQVTEEEIKQCIEEYLANVPQLKQKFINAPPFYEENLQRNLFGQEQFLLISKYKLHELPLNLLKRLPIHLVKQFVVQVEYDSYWYWALTNDIVKATNFQCSLKDWALLRSFETLMASHFASLTAFSFRSQPLERLNRATSDIVSAPVKVLVSNCNNVLMYICYPVLESLAKFALSPLLDCNGKPTANFSVRHNDRNRNFTPSDNPISNLATILRALEKYGQGILGKPDLTTNLKDFRLQIENMPSLVPLSGHDGWDSVYQLRNVVLHGAKGWQLRSGLITHLICLIMWNILDEQILTKALERVSQRPPFFLEQFFYPPEF